MSRGGQNWKGGRTVEATRSLDVMRLARAGLLVNCRLADSQWTYSEGTRATIAIKGGRDRIVLKYRFRSYGQEWESIEQPVPTLWTPCRFGGERPWFICDVRANGVYCGRKVTKLYGGGRLFACRHCYRLGYAVQRIGPLDKAHHNLERLHRKLNAHYERPDLPAPPKPKWMRWKTYRWMAQQIEDGRERLDEAFIVGAQRILASIERVDHRRRSRR
jgi:hypothetical protein